ncbi:MAG: hypothetical protein E7503_02530 [Ruminococcus sp.]|nr:hypothetical protein [Ruminococcus sp.]
MKKQKGLTMRIQKMLSALTACCLGATAMVSMPMQVNAADETLTFDFQCAGANSITLTAEAVAQGDVTLPISIYITENPGVNAISLKMQINDGQEAEDGSLGNYGITMVDGDFASPYCFDSVCEGDANLALSAIFTSEKMNIGWIYTFDQTLNADAYAEAGTTSWDSSVSWATQYAFAEASLVIPQGIAPGTYVLDVRREKYVNALSTDDNVFYSQTRCKAAGVEGALEYNTVPFTVIVEEEGVTETTTTETTTESTTTETTTTETTTTETTTTETTTTETTTTESGYGETTTESVPAETFPAEVLPDGSDAYADLLAGEDFTYIFGNVAGTPGSTVKMPVYIYNDPGTAGAMYYIDYDAALQDAAITQGTAYRISMQCNANSNPLAVVWATGDGGNMTAKDGAVFVYLSFTIPEDAAVGTTYQVGTAAGKDENTPTEVNNTDGVALDLKSVNGTITVVAAEDEVALNYDRYSFAGVGDSVALELLNAAEGEVQWYTSDPAVASVVASGNMAVVTAETTGNCQVFAVYNGVTYVCEIRGGLFGDVDANGKIDSSDAILILKEYNSKTIMGVDFLTEAERLVADVTGEGIVDTQDAIPVLTYYTIESIIGDDASWFELTGNPNAPDAP